MHLVGNLIKIEILEENRRKEFEEKYLPILKEKYKDYNFIILKNKYKTTYKDKEYRIFNINNIKPNLQLETIAIVDHFEVEEIRGNYKHKISLDNFFAPTSINCELFIDYKKDIRINDIVKIKGIVREIPINEDKKHLRYYIEADEIEILNREEIDGFEKYKTKRYLLTAQSNLSNGFINEKTLERYSNKIEHYCFADYNTLNFVENKNNVPLCLRCYFEAYNDKKYSVFIFLNQEDEEIEYEENKIKVNKGIRALNELISTGENYKDGYLVNYDKLMKYKEYFLLGSLDKEGLVFQSLLDDDYDLLKQYIDMFSIIGIEPLDNLKSIQKEGRKNSSISNLKKVNEIIRRISIKENKVLIFADNPVVVNKEDREIVREFILANKLKNNKHKNENINKLRNEIDIEEISFVRSIPEIIEELKIQGFNLKDIQNIIFNEIVFYSSLISKDKITIIPDTVFLEKSANDNKQLKDCLSNIIADNKLERKYLDRLKDELKIIFNKKYSKIFLAALAVVKVSKEYNYPISERGTASNMLLTYLLGISSIDPIKYNLNYNMFLGNDNNKMPDIDINVSSEIIKEIIEEINKYFKNTIKASIASTAKELYIKQLLNRLNSTIDFEYASNLMSNKLLRIQPHNSGIMLLPNNIDINYIFPTIKYNDDFIPAYPYEYIENKIPKIDILSKNDLNILKNIETIIQLKEIDLNSEEIYNFINLKSEDISELNTDYAKKIIDIIKPNNFNDLVVIQGLLHGKGVFSSAEYCKNNNMKIISSREDLLNLLEKYNIQNSFNIMEIIRKGKFEFLTEDQINELKEKLPNKYFKILSKIKYLFPRSHAIAYAKQSCYSAYYKIHEKEILKSKEQIKILEYDDGISLEDIEEFLTED